MTQAAAGAPEDSTRADVRGAALVLAVSAGVYAVLTCPGVFWGDSAEFARRAATLELSPVARGYPLHRVLTWLAGRATGSPALGANAVSTVFGAVSAALAYETGRRLSRSRAGGFAAAATLGLCPAYCLFVGVAEVYTLHTALLLGLLLAAFDVGDSRRARVSLGLLLGLSFLHHRMTAFAVPGLAVQCAVAFARRRGDGGTARRVREVAGGFAAGVVPFAVLCAAASRAPPADAAAPAAWWLQDVFLGGERNAANFLGTGVRGFGENLAYLAKWIVYDLPGPALVLAGWGLVRLVRSRREEAWMFAALVPFHLVFPLRYDWTGDQFSFLLPFCAVAAVLAAEGVAGVRAAWGPRVAGAAAASAAAAPVASALALAFTPLGERLLPGVEDEARRLLVLPVRIAYDRPRTVCTVRLSRLPRGARLHADWGDGQVYLYLQEADGLRRDVVVAPWYGDRIRLRRDGTEEWISVMPGRRALPDAVSALGDAVEDRGGGLLRVRDPR